jgi:very-short-patch-repair endonuclease
LLVCHSKALDGNTTTRDGIPITTPERTVIDLAAQLDRKATARLFREAIRLKLATAQSLMIVLERHPNARGSADLRKRAKRYAALPYHRARSDAEARALEILHDAGAQPLNVNERIAGEEADLSDPKRKRIIEIDGPQFHLFPEEDARKQAAWEEAGYVVERIASDDVYDRPWRLISLAKE